MVFGVAPPPGPGHRAGGSSPVSAQPSQWQSLWLRFAGRTPCALRREWAQASGSKSVGLGKGQRSCNFKSSSHLSPTPFVFSPNLVLYHLSCLASAYAIDNNTDSIFGVSPFSKGTQVVSTPFMCIYSTWDTFKMWILSQWLWGGA